MIEEFKFSFNDLNVSEMDIEELLGTEGEIPEPFPQLIEKGLHEAPEHCEIRGGIKIFSPVFTDSKSNTVKIEHQTFRTAKIVAIQLKNATSAALFTCTAGKGISDYATRVAAEGDPMYSYVLDVIGSVTVDKAMDKIQDAVKARMKQQGLGISDRFSPGYCEWNVADQQKLFSLLPSNFCGVELSDSSLMDPIKSVSGIIGIGPGLEQKGYQCYWCNDPNCIYGKTRQKKTAKKID
mgnify:CR=1 FL=1